MIRLIVAAATLVGLAAGPARAADTISLQPGEAVTIVIDDGGRTNVEKGGAARPMSDEDKAMVRDLLVNHPEAFGPRAAVITAKGATPAPAVTRGEVHFSFMTFGEGNERLLIVENGYGRGLRYRAIMHRGGRAEPTDVCVVIPERRSYEHWSYPIDRIDLGGITLVPYRDGEVPTCE
jgi:hypothetical protein